MVRVFVNRGAYVKRGRAAREREDKVGEDLKGCYQ